MVPTMLASPPPVVDQAVALLPTHTHSGAGGGAGVRRLTRGETLFHAGDRRNGLYKVERGALCHYVRWPDGRHEVIEFAFPGDIIGFGHLDFHASTAQAAARTIVSPVDEVEFERLVESDGMLSARYAAAADREFEFLRLRALQSTQNAPARRVASFLAALAQLSAREGRDPSTAADELTSGIVAEQLDMSVDTFAGVLSELKTRGILADAGESLRISDIAALEKFADAA